MIQAIFILTRAVHFSACLVILGAFAFDACIAAPACNGAASIKQAWRGILRRLLLAALVMATVSGGVWLVFVAMEMSGLPLAEAVQPDVLSRVWGQTQFGHVWATRAVLLVATGLLAWVAMRRGASRRSTAPGLAMSILLAASVAWAGHGQTDGLVTVHLIADVVHIVAGGFWPGGLAPLAMLLFAARHLSAADCAACLGTIVHRFSTMSLAAVAALVGSGIANSWFLLGPWSNLYRTPYGILLAAKVGIFCFMLALGARNLLKWKPDLSANEDRAGTALRRIRFNVLLETTFAIGVLFLVGALGLAPPPAMEIPHHHHHEVSMLKTTTGADNRIVETAETNSGI